MDKGVCYGLEWPVDRPITRKGASVGLLAEASTPIPKGGRCGAAVRFSQTRALRYLNEIRPIALVNQTLNILLYARRPGNACLKPRLVFQSSRNHLLTLIKYLQGGHWRYNCHTLRRLLSSAMYISNEP